MVARIVSGRNIRGALNYNEQKVEQGRASFLHAENYLSSHDSKERLFVLQHRAKLNERTKTNCLHISLNFETNEQISRSKMKEVARDYMERIGFGAQPYLVYLHEDAAHPHLHIVSTNINAQGNRISLHNLGKGLSELARKEIEIKYNLVQAEGRGKEEPIPVIPLNQLRKAEYGQEETKKLITQIVNTVVGTYNFTSITELNAVLKGFNILADRGHEKSNMFHHKGLLYCIIDEKGNKLGVPIKASRIAGKHTIASLEKRFARNKPKRKILGAALKHRIDQVLNSSTTQREFEAKLKADQIAILYRTNKEGFVYGITYIDHAVCSVFNGSELGKAYSAKALTGQFKQLKGNTLTAEKVYKGKDQSIVNPSTYLENTGSTNYLDILLGKPEQDHTAGVPRKRKRRKKRQQQINL